ncbi:dihydroxyacetone kinase [Ophiostoma piceae UAMH 11346]|uniref:Dihydroxyacetone kinase n=1 Tax=Ophiostoma piceae (strain UAMH 11346) TaxID=1262450 RepID=S3CKL3_OPHP1|nr:dihydroxyacetone kinase [Ophiostoma piceae UAMH 11346]
MSKAHLFNSADGLVPKALRGLIAYNPALALDINNRVVFDTSYDRSKVAIISGGGSGHEPAWAGYVGTNMLAASAAGDIFASPSTKQIVAAVNAVPSDAGTILVITNYTGDCLHFGLAAEKANAAGHKCRMIICGDDVSVGKSGGRLVGRRGLAGQIGVLKAIGGCAGTASNATLDNVYNLGVAVSKQIVSMAATLEHCHVPGRGDDEEINGDGKVGEKIEIGTGPHNEPGYRTLSPAPTAPQLVANLLKHCLDETDANRAYVNFAPQDETAVLVSNFGGLSQLELSALVDEVLSQIERDWSATVAPPTRVYAGCLETSLNAPAFSLSVINLSAAARDPACVYSVDEIKGFFDVRTSTYWESFAGSQGVRRPRASQIITSTAAEEAIPTSFEHDILIDASRLEKGLRKACMDLAEAEPDLTKWDTLMGDGDCGETLKTGALAMLAAVDDKQRPLASFGSSVAVLRELESVVENKMGGTLGGILGIFLVSLRASLEAEVAKDAKVDPSAAWASALHTAIDHLGHYTPAKVGDRTVMDTLIPFAESMARGFAAAVSAAEAGAEKTRTLTPKLGRATYVGAGQDNSGDLPPDPGAWGVMVAIRGLQQGFSS